MTERIKKEHRDGTHSDTSAGCGDDYYTPSSQSDYPTTPIPFHCSSFHCAVKTKNMTTTKTHGRN